MNRLSDAPLARLLPALGALLLFGLCGSVLLGYQLFSPLELWQAWSGADGPAAHILREWRVPRALMAPLVGAALALAGVLLQSLTRNPLAAPEMVGMNAAAALAVVALSFVAASPSLLGLSAAALGGALGSALLVYLVAGSEPGASKLRLPLIGAALMLMFGALTQALLGFQESTLDQILFWLSGSLAGRSWPMLEQGLPLLLGGALLTLLAAPHLDLFLLDAPLAASLGQPVRRARALAFGAAACLGSAAVVMAGPIPFVGLVAPHAARLLVGGRHRRLLPVAALLGALLLTLADIGARFIVYPDEAPVGAVVALLGVPLFLRLLQRRLGVAA